MAYTAGLALNGSLSLWRDYQGAAPWTMISGERDLSGVLSLSHLDRSIHLHSSPRHESISTFCLSRNLVGCDRLFNIRYRCASGGALESHGLWVGFGTFQRASNGATLPRRSGVGCSLSCCSTSCQLSHQLPAATGCANLPTFPIRLCRGHFFSR